MRRLNPNVVHSNPTSTHHLSLELSPETPLARQDSLGGNTKTLTVNPNTEPYIWLLRTKP